MRILHPRPALGRQRHFDVEFTDGVARVESLHPERELAFRVHGFTIEPDREVEAPFQEGLGDPIVDLTALTIPQLRKIAGDRVKIPARATKDEAVALVAGLPATPIPGSIDHGDGVFTAPADGVQKVAVESLDG